MLTFPELHSARFCPINLDSFARRYNQQQDEYTNANPFLDPQTCLKRIQEEHARLGTDCSYGGLFEDRRHLWRGSYLEETQEWMHLGVDVNVPAKTKIAATWNAEVIHMDNDTPLVGGWGPRIIVRLLDEPNILLIFAHLGEILFEKGDVLSSGTIFATVGTPPNNGMWFPHVHVQAVDQSHYLHDLEFLVQKLDGYAGAHTLKQPAMMFPDPMRFIRLWK